MIKESLENYKKLIEKIYKEEGYICAIIFTNELKKEKKISEEENKNLKIEIIKKLSEEIKKINEQKRSKKNDW